MRTPAFDSFDKETLIRFLGDVIEAEMGKPDDEINLELIEECDGFLSELLSDVTISDGQMKENIAKIKGMATFAEIPPIRTRRMPRPRRLVAAILAAVLLIGGSLTAYAFVPAFRDVVCYVLKLERGSTVDDGGVTYTYSGKAVKYQSIEELVQKENLNILYPHNLPETLKIKAIIGSGEGESLTYNIAFVDGVTAIRISVGEIDSSTLSTNSEAYENKKGILSYILFDGNKVTSVISYNGYTYYISAINRSNMITILENLY